MIVRPSSAPIFVVVSLLASASARGAADSPVARADQLIAQGFALRLQNKNAEALELFAKAHAIAPSGKTLGQMGSVEVALHRWVDAESHLEEALQRHDSPWIEAPKNRQMLEKTLAEARQHVARLQFRGTGGARVSVDGKEVGALPLPRPVPAAEGTIHVSATATGFQPLHREIVAQGASEVTVDLQFIPAAPAPPAALSVAVGATPPSEGKRPAWRLWTGSALMAAGLGSVGLGIGWLVVDGKTMCDAPPGGVCKYLYDTKAQGWLAIGLGAATAGAGAMLLLWAPKHSPVTVAAGPASIGFAGRF
jgi:hypothetical protein